MINGKPRSLKRPKGGYSCVEIRKLGHKRFSANRSGLSPGCLIEGLPNCQKDLSTSTLWRKIHIIHEEGIRNKETNAIGRILTVLAAVFSIAENSSGAGFTILASPDFSFSKSLLSQFEACTQLEPGRP